MVIRTKGIIALAVLGIIVVFLDQNNRPIPVKIILGEPYLVPLSIIIIASIVLGIILTVTIAFMIKKFQIRRALAKAKELEEAI